MGNSPPTGGLRLGNADWSYVASVGPCVEIRFRGRKVKQGNEEESTESWETTYIAGMTNCSFSLSKNFRNTMSPTHLDAKLEIIINDNAPGFDQTFRLILQREATTGLLHFNDESTWTTQHCKADNFVNSTTNACGDIIQTIFDIYGSEKTKGLFVREYKRRSNDKDPYTVTVAHYYLNADDGVSVGFSVAVKKIRLLYNGNFDFAVDGPEQHPVDALAYMFREVVRTKTWKPTHCPHCANKYILERQSESESDTDNVLPPPLHGRGRNPGSSINSNTGWFKGKDIGNTYINKQVLWNKKGGSYYATKPI